MLTSCTQTIVERVECTNWKVVDIEVPENSWGWNANGGYYTATVNVPELTTYVFTDGYVQCYAVDGDYQFVLPYTRYKADGDYRWETTVDYEFTPGRVDFYCTANDFVEDLPSIRYFRLVLHW